MVNTDRLERGHSFRLYGFSGFSDGDRPSPFHVYFIGFAAHSSTEGLGFMLCVHLSTFEHGRGDDDSASHPYLYFAVDAGALEE